MSAILPIRTDGTPLIKMCGLRRAADLIAARQAGADLIGLVFAPSRRRVDLAEARAVLDQAGDHPPVVGVFVNESAKTMRAAVDALGLALVQLSGDESPALAAGLEVPFLKTIHLREGMAADEALGLMARYPLATAFLLDSWSEQGGGSGITADWRTAAAIIAQAPAPVFLAGGLRADNVAEALAQTGAQGMDVSSGIECEGWKDPARMAAFAQAVRGARGTGKMAGQTTEYDHGKETR